MSYFFFPAAAGFQAVGKGHTAWESLKRAVGVELANRLCDAMENVQWEIREQDGFFDECADLILKENGEIIGRFERI